MGMDVYERALKMHEENKGKISVESKVPLGSKDDLSLAYSPGVAEPCRKIAENPDDVYRYTGKGNAVAIVSDGSAVLGLGNIGAAASLPVMEGKALLLKNFAGVDAYPIVLDTQDVDEIVQTVRMIAPGFGGVNLEDISAPRCFEVEERLQDLGIPVFHDDQHGTAMVVLAGLMNACKVLGKQFTDLRVVVNGAGAAGVAITKLLLGDGNPDERVADVIVCDSRGIIVKGRENLNPVKKALAELTNSQERSGGLGDALVGADVFIGVSVKDVLTTDMIDGMNDDPIVFALANPDPEISPILVAETKAAIYATGRSDIPNQINNVLVFPAIFRVALDLRLPRFTPELFRATAKILASYVTDPSVQEVLPDPLDPGVVPYIVQELKERAGDFGVSE